MVRNKFLLLFLFISFETVSAGTTYRCLVFLKDKPQLFDPSQFYTKKALEKRIRYQIPFDDDDKPCNPDYLNRLSQLGATVIGSSRWFNAVQINISDVSILDRIKMLPFVKNVRVVGDINGKSKNAKYSGTQSCDGTSDVLDADSTYMQSYSQVHQMNGDYLHDLGYKGQGMVIAILDAGFINANTVSSLHPIFTSNRLLGAYDYVQRDSNVYESSSHGLNCFGLIGAVKPNEYQGSAADASFYLFKTENVSSELISEEYNLSEGLERCDQLGVDVATISLGYTEFDSSSENHTYAQLDGHTTVAAKAVNKASSKGILVCVAAGNEGGSSWHYISTPADADSALTVAAIDSNGNPASFSSYGFDSDPRVKPNVGARGVYNPVINSSDAIVYGSGTSYATPLLAGMAASLWQAYPAKTNWEIKTAIEQSASQYNTPDKRIGYGIPNFAKAYNSLKPSAVHQYQMNEEDVLLFPNPFSDQMVIRFNRSLTNVCLSITNLIGQMIWNEQLSSVSNEDYIVNAAALSALPKGVYLVQVSCDEGMVLKKIIKD